MTILMPAGRGILAAGKGSGLWTPASVTTAFWYDASDATTINAGSPVNNDWVSSWADKSGNGRTLTNSGSTTFQPFYNTNVQNSLPAIDLSVARGRLASPVYNLAQPFLIVAVFRTLSSVSSNRLFDNSGETGSRVLMLINHPSFSSNYTTFCDAGVASGVTLVANTAYYVSSVCNNTSSQARVNGVGTTGTAGTGGINGGMIFAPVTWDPNIKLCEIFCIPNSTAGDLTNAEAYVAAKWGI